jgi:hypothetical protein
MGGSRASRRFHFSGDILSADGPFLVTSAGYFLCCFRFAVDFPWNMDY